MNEIKKNTMHTFQVVQNSNDQNVNIQDLAIQNEMLSKIKWNSEGLITAIAQDHLNGDILMLAWMNEEALRETLATMRGVYFSRSRNKLWRKGEESGHIQLVKSLFLDCDGDAIILKIEQIAGIACHTGRRSCFYRQATQEGWKIIAPVLG